ncbi:MAG: FAD-binding oxidoreductase [Pseudomonadota bacterium]
MELLDQMRATLGETYVLTGEDTAKWARDWTGKYAWTPRAVLRPADTGGLSAVAAACHAARVAMVPVGGNTGLTGATRAEGAVMISLDRMNTVESVKPAARVARVGGGAILQNVHEAAAAHGLIFPLTFGARGSATIGGALATNAGGSNVLRYGTTRDLCLGLEVVLPDGRVLDLMGELRKDNSGYALRQLFIGAEGTLGFITKAALKLFEAPRVRVTAMAAFARLDDTLDLLNALQAATGGAVEAFEYMPRRFIDRHIARKGGSEPFAGRHEVNVLIEVASTRADDAAPGAEGTGSALLELVTGTLAQALDAGKLSDAVVAQNEAQRSAMWARREAAAEITFLGGPIVDTDIAVPLDAVPRFLSEVAPRITALDHGATDFVVSHLGDGNLHYTVYPTRDDAALKVAMIEVIEDVTLALGGTFSAEHGIGLSKLGSMVRRKDAAALDTMRALKASLDPHGVMNPGKVLP